MLTSLSLSVLVLYDHLLTLNDEVRLIWPAKVRRDDANVPANPHEQHSQTSIVKVLFLVNRYSVPFCLVMTAYGEDTRFGDIVLDLMSTSHYRNGRLSL